MALTQSHYDFIIVGGGTAGCLLAHRLSHSAAARSVLLLEAGTKPSGPYLSAPGHRYTAAFARSDLDHGYVSEPEPSLNGRELPYARGKGLGGSSILNFGVYLYGSGEDYDRWADLVDDDDWAWSSAQESFRTIEHYATESAAAYKHLADPASGRHGTSGQVTVSLPPVLEKSVAPQMASLLAAGESLCLDPNAGDNIGVSLFPYSYGKSGRCTSAIAHLVDPPKNLEVWTDATVGKLFFDGTSVIGVRTIDGREALSNKEVILCCGAIDTPRLLLLNGIGPKAELEALDVEVIKDLPGVGKHLRDHVAGIMCVEVDGSFNDRTTFETDPKSVEEAQALWDQDHTGALSLQHSSLWGGFLKVPNLEKSSEFQNLAPADQEFLTRSKVPHFEFLNNALLWPPGSQLTPGNTYLSFTAALMNAQSEGSVTLRSKNPTDKPLLRLNLLSHPYDVLVIREAIRRSWNMIIENPDMRPHVRKTLSGPASLSDADIDAYAKAEACPIWHANGTARMGKEADGGSVDSSGKVYGVQGLRVADLRVCPLTTNNHTQATAYLVGQKIAEKMKDPTSGQTGDVPAEDIENNTEYLANVTIGTPGQTFALDFDTGSADLWVWSTELSVSTRNGNHGGNKHSIFDPKKSSTFKKSSGSLGKSNMEMAIELAKTLSTQFASGPGDGLLGLAFGSINTVQPSPAQTVVENMITQIDIPKNTELFTAYLGSTHPGSSSDSSNGSATTDATSFYPFGYIDQTALAGQTPAYFPWTTRNEVGDKTINRSGNQSIADTGTTLALVGDDLCEAVYGAIPGATKSTQQQGWVFPTSTDLSSLPTVRLAIGDTLFTINPEELPFQDLGDGTFYGGIQSRGDQTFDIYGDVFLRSVYAIFDQGNTRFGCTQRASTLSSNGEKY
ncbi:hypothetical protein TI39_contig5889g00004 [Zymoseptoria brevis]|uniref:Peptidase A1 domain-containing protein n=1 Tax=Zymoseptoria brevis TaxID=1047168 RepID=A0A0F4G580_9PEZI|nr:hypothetical protein TI39_contig5889g00004 [Zymoseptoria brevis]